MKATCSQCRKYSATHRVGSTVMCAECVFATSPQTQRKARIINRKAASKRIMLPHDVPTLIESPHSNYAKEIMKAARRVFLGQ